MTKQEAAEANFLNGYNCCQAVLLAFCEELHMTQAEAARLGSSFGGGVGGLRQMCGAFTALCMIEGVSGGYDDPADKAGKAAQYQRIQAYARAFTAENGSILCAKLLNGCPHAAPLPAERTPAYYKERPCARYVGSAARLIDTALQERKGN